MPYNIIDVDVRDVIGSNPTAKEFFNTRMKVVDDKHSVQVPTDYMSFFIRYRNCVNSTTKIIKRSSKEWCKFSPKDKAPACLMYSGGSESTLLASCFVGLPMIRCHNFYPCIIPKHKREIQLALVGAVLGYRITLMGISVMDYYTPYIFEYSEDFLMLWNQTFPDTIIQFPHASFSKSTVYKTLIELRKEFQWCEKINSPCGNCWNCFEAFCLLIALEENISTYFPNGYNKDEFFKMNEEAHNSGYYDPYVSNELVMELEKNFQISFRERLK